MTYKHYRDNGVIIPVGTLVRDSDGNDYIIMRSSIFDGQVLSASVSSGRRAYMDCDKLEVIFNELEVSDFEGNTMPIGSCIKIDIVSTGVEWIPTQIVKDNEIDEHFCICSDCEALHYEYDSHKYGYNSICEICFDNNYSICRDCDRMCHLDDTTDGYCGECYRNEEEIKERDTGDKIVGGRGYIKSTRMFGVEIECDIRDIDVIEMLPSDLGVAKDGSVGGRLPVEFVTPPLGGDDGEKWLENVCTKLESSDAVVNKSCGMHIHIESKDFLNRFVKLRSLILFYQSIEDVIFSFVPYSRRNNNYCRRIKDVINVEKLKSCYNISQFEQAFYNTSYVDSEKGAKYNSKRYAFVNIHRLFFSGQTIEIRNHSGTINYKKIITWVQLHSSIIDLVANKKNTDIVRYIKKMSKLGLVDKTKYLFELLQLDNNAIEFLIGRQKKFNPSIGQSALDIFNPEKRGQEDDEI